MRVERFKMEREGLVTEGQGKKCCDRSVHLSCRAIHCDVRNLSYKTENKVKKGKNTENRTDRQRILSVSRD